MENCKFSETQFSFCFTFEYITQFFPRIPLPIFPNTVVEGRPGGGYDMAIDGNIFFQFKIPVYHDKVSNWFRKHWRVFNHEYYKIKLQTDGNQYLLLKQLAQQAGNEVYYATPEFHTINDLTNCYSANNIVRNSGIFSLRDLPHYQSGRHHLIYSPRHNWAQLFSEPIKIPSIKSINPFELFQRSEENISVYKQAVEIANTILQIENSEVHIEFTFNEPAQLVRQVHSVLLSCYNVHWYPVFRF